MTISNPANGSAANGRAPGGVNVIIPMGGLGARFAKAGYIPPKPLIPIFGRPMLSWLVTNLRFAPGDVLYVALQQAVDDTYDIGGFLQREFEQAATPYAAEDCDGDGGNNKPETMFVVPPVEIVHLHGLTEGAAETLYKVTGACTTTTATNGDEDANGNGADGEKHTTNGDNDSDNIKSKGIPQDRLHLKTISLDCDTIYFSDVLSKFRALPDGVGCSMYFSDPTAKEKPIFSYIALDDAGHVTAIKEKVAISTNANTGAYGFPSAGAFNTAFESMRRRGDSVSKQLGEFYTSGVIADMVSAGVRFKGLFVNHFECVGTPDQLVAFFHKTAQGHRVVTQRQWLLLQQEGEDTEDGGDKNSGEKKIPVVKTKVWLDVDTLLQEGKGEKLGETNVDEQVMQLLGDDKRKVVEQARAGALMDVGFSASSVDGTSAQLATAQERAVAKTYRRLVSADSDLQKELGWYV